MQTKEAAAKVICKTNLDNDLLGWSNNEFYSVNALSRTWRKIIISDANDRYPDCDFRMVAQKVREFLEEYRGEMRDPVIAQLAKLENKIIPLPPITSVPTPIRKVRILEKPNYFGVLAELATLTEKQASADFLPYLPIDASCCRCTWIYCPSKTVVLLPKKSGEYIHANTVSLGQGLSFIATIYPFKNRAWFWQMVQMKGNLIVDVTNKNDLSRRSIQPYYPTLVNETLCYDEMEVTCLEAKQINETLLHYTLLVKNSEAGEEKIVDRMHYIGWEDVQGTNEHELLDLIEAMQPYLNQAGVPIVHCMGGVGRTGTALAGVALDQLHRQCLLNRDNRLQQMGYFIIEGRKQRGPEFLQTATQIETLWKLTDVLLADEITD